MGRHAADRKKAGGLDRLPVPQKALDDLLRAALAEDIGTGDVTTESLFSDKVIAEGRLVAKADGVLCGLPVFCRVFALLSPKVSFHLLRKDGQTVRRGDAVAVVRGPAHALLAGERTALNILQRLSGIATLTHAFSQAVGPRVLLKDTRKTTPLFRHLEKYAVRVGGGANHRFGLYDMVLIKDNHIACLMAAEGVSRSVAVRECVARAKAATKGTLPVEVEVNSFCQAVAAAEAGADIVMFDHASASDVRRFSRWQESAGRKVVVEWSGGVTLRTIPRISHLPVDWVSAGCLTQSAPALDFSFEIPCSS